MGKWREFQDKLEEFGNRPNPLVIPDPEPLVPKVPEPPMRSWRQELLNKSQMQDLEDTVNSPGYEVLQDLWESTLEGFVTFLVELDTADDKKILDAHKIVHGLHLGIKSINAQVNGYAQLLQAEREESAALTKALNPEYGSDPLENTDILGKLLNPIHQSAQKETLPLRAHKTAVETPLDKMLRARENKQ